MVFIYALYDDDTILYVGSTKDMARRFKWHKNKNLNKGCALTQLNDISRVKIIELEETSDELRRVTEGFYIDWLKPTLNKRGAGLTDEECKARWAKANREWSRNYLRRWRAQKRASST